MGGLCATSAIKTRLTLIETRVPYHLIPADSKWLKLQMTGSFRNSFYPQVCFRMAIECPPPENLFFNNNNPTNS